MKELAGFAASTGAGVGVRLVGAPWWAVVVLVLGLSVVFLLALQMSYQNVYRLASLSKSGIVKGHGGIEWKAASEPNEAEPTEPEPPRPRRRWIRRKPPPDSS